MKQKFSKTIKWAIMVFLFGVFVISCKKDEVVTPGDAFIISFSVGDVTGTIDETAKTIAAALAPGTDLSTVTPTLVLSEGATVSPASGVATNFTSPVVFTVTDKTGKVTNVYTVTLSSATLRKIAFIGAAAANTDAAWQALAGPDYDLMDDKTAAKWCETQMTSSTTVVTYLSFKAVADGADLSSYHTLWIQFDGGWWGGEVAQFPANAAWCLLNDAAPVSSGGCADVATNFVTAIKEYYDNGGNLFLGIYAGSIVDEIGVVSAPEYAPNNNWGGLTVDDGATAGAWDVNWYAATSHPVFNGITLGGGCTAPSLIMLSSGTLKKNRSNQYNLDFGPWAPNGDADALATRYASFKTMTGASFLISNCNGNEGQMVEYAAKSGKGTVISALSGTYDWYTGTDNAGASLNTAGNIETITRNSLNYLVDLKLGLVKK
jgi:hypothetical protein